METVAKKRKAVKTKSVRISGAEAVIRALIYEKVKYIFGYPGGAIMPIYDSLYLFENQVKHFLTRHEQGATHAAQGFARVTGKTGVCFATSGPGATNLITGIADAQIDSTPMVCITGQVPKHLLGTDAFQETDIIDISMPVTKWNFQVTKASEIPEAIAKAFYIANSGRPGPVLVDITKNAQIEEFDFEYKPIKKIRSYQPYPVLDNSAVEEAAKLINKAKKPFILCGQGVSISKAEKVFTEMVEKTGIPVASTLMGLSAFPDKHPLNVGYLGMHGNYGPNIKTNECDLLIAIGMRFDDRVTGDLERYAKQAKVIHIDIDQAEIDKNVKTDVAIISDAKAAIIALTPHLKVRKHTKWLKEFAACDAIEYQKVIKGDLEGNVGEIKMTEVVDQLSKLTKGESVVVTDVGQHQMVASRYYKFSKPLSNVTSGGLGTMGFALPAAIGAKIGQPKRDVVAIIGDGGFQMTLQELGTILHYKVPVKILILNNSFLGMVRQWQQLFFDRRYSFTEMVNPDFTKIAEAYGIESERISEREDLDGALDRMMKCKDSFLLEVVVKKEDNVFPMITSGSSVSEIRLE